MLLFSVPFMKILIYAKVSDGNICQTFKLILVLDTELPAGNISWKVIFGFKSSIGKARFR